MLTGKDIKKSFGNREILSGIDIVVRPGEVTALMGPSGSGKTTLLRALSLTEPAEEGFVMIDGVKFLGKNEKTWPTVPWPSLTVVFQDLFLWPHLNCRQNIEIAIRDTRKGSKHNQKSFAVCEELQIAGLMELMPRDLSRGQRQLVALARALVLNPKYLLIDEVSASLDVVRAAKVGKLLRRVAENGVGILVITHQPAFVRNVCDHMDYISGGKIVESGAPSILDSPKSSELIEFVKSIQQAI